MQISTFKNRDLQTSHYLFTISVLLLCAWCGVFYQVLAENTNWKKLCFPDLLTTCTATRMHNIPRFQGKRKLPLPYPHVLCHTFIIKNVKCFPWVYWIKGLKTNWIPAAGGKLTVRLSKILVSILSPLLFLNMSTSTNCRVTQVFEGQREKKTGNKWFKSPLGLECAQRLY